MDVRQKFPNIIRNYGDPNYTYMDHPAYTELFDDEVIHVRDVGDYQGDSYVLLRRGSRWAFTVFGYGSCSGCDWLQGCETYDDLQEVADSLNDVDFKSATELLDELEKKYNNQDSVTWWSASDREGFTDFCKEVEGIVSRDDS